MFEVLGVIDVRRGLAVRARGGQRQKYAPVESVAGEMIDSGDSAALSRQYVDRFGLPALYVADLDAIERRLPPHAAVQMIASIGVPVWLDAGIASSDDARRAQGCGVSRLVVGLETLPAFDVLESIVKAVGRDCVVFSLDLRHGQPIAVTPELARQRPEDLTEHAADAGAGAVLVLDLARVGMGSGLDCHVLERIKRAAGSVPLYVGGGVRGRADLDTARRLGCAGALVASALLDGHLTKRDLSYTFWSTCTQYLVPNP
jgi:phosphoribosylformimino-5-aminoimidazole carboxamide ribotide isomerase